MIKKFIEKMLENISSKRFITLMIATWFVFEGLAIDANWILLAGFYMGVDTAKNEGVFAAFNEFLKLRGAKNA